MAKCSCDDLLQGKACTNERSPSADIHELTPQKGSGVPDPASRDCRTRRFKSMGRSQRSITLHHSIYQGRDANFFALSRSAQLFAPVPNRLPVFRPPWSSQLHVSDRHPKGRFMDAIIPQEGDRWAARKRQSEPCRALSRAFRVSRSVPGSTPPGMGHN